MSLDVAAAFQIQALTAYHLLHTVHDLKAGATVLVHAIGGGLGLFVTQLAVMAGARVIGTVGSDGKSRKPIELGAGCVIDRRNEDFIERVMAFTEGGGVDLAIDSLGADTLDRTFNCVRYLGHVISIGEAEGMPFQNLRERLIPRSLTFTRFHAGHVLHYGELWRNGLDFVIGAIGRGELEVPIVARYALENAREMHARLEERGVSGKLLLGMPGHT
ncbi:MAG: zinc-binding dehydrogenase [Steroidobacteraceae bacterium]